MRKINETTFGKEIKNNPKDRIEVEVGDSKQEDFKPQFKIMRWDNEVNFSLRAKEHPAATVEFEGEKVKYITPEYEVHQYDKPEAGEDGGFEFEWILKQKPASNVLEATIETKGLNFFYQPALTQEEIDEGAAQPENVVGSYAVYHATKGGLNRADGMEYKTGKAFHIYRPKATDANQNETWCTLHIDIDTNLLTVEVPQKFLDEAVYPVVVDPTFGYTSIGAGSRSINSGNARGSGLNLSVSVDGEVDSIQFHGSDASANIKGFVTDTSYNIITNGITPATAVATSSGWTIASYSTKPLVASGVSYHPWFTNNNAISSIHYDAGSNSGDGLADTSYTSYASPGNPSSPNLSTDKYSIYATYTAGGTAHEKSLTDTVSLADAISKQAGLVKTDAMTLAEAVVNAPVLVKADAMSLADAIVKITGLNKIDAVAIADQFASVFDVLRSFSDTVTIADLKSASVGKALIDTFQISDDIDAAIILAQGLSDTISISDALQKQVGVSKTDAITLADAIIKAIGTFKQDTVSVADAKTVQSGKAITDSQSIADSMNAAILLAHVVADTITIADSLVKSTGVSRTDAIQIADAIVKKAGKKVSDSVSISDLIGQVNTSKRSLSDTVNIIDSFAREITQLLELSDIMVITDEIAFPGIVTIIFKKKGKPFSSKIDIYKRKLRT